MEKIKTVILCGGRGTRLSEETQVKPKPMVEIGHFPILWHIMKTYAHYGHNEFLLALGYKGYVIKEYFMDYHARKNDYHARKSDVTVNLATGESEHHATDTEDWLVHMIETGADTLTGGRLGKLRPHLAGVKTFMLTYGDGLADVDVAALLDFHRAHGKTATITAVRPPARFGSLGLDGDRVVEFKEKSQADEGWINGGYFVFETGVFDYVDEKTRELERKPLERLAAEGELMAFQHPGFWHPMDTTRDRDFLCELLEKGKAPWKVWP